MVACPRNQNLARISQFSFDRGTKRIEINLVAGAPLSVQMRR